MRQITVKLTVAEAKAVLRAMGNSIDNPDDAKDILGAPATMKAAYRASEKICRVLYGPKGAK